MNSDFKYLVYLLEVASAFSRGTKISRKEQWHPAQVFAIQLKLAPAIHTFDRFKHEMTCSEQLIISSRKSWQRIIWLVFRNLKTCACSDHWITDTLCFHICFLFLVFPMCHLCTNLILLCACLSDVGKCTLSIYLRSSDSDQTTTRLKYFVNPSALFPDNISQPFWSSDHKPTQASTPCFLYIPGSSVHVFGKMACQRYNISAQVFLLWQENKGQLSSACSETFFQLSMDLFLTDLGKLLKQPIQQRPLEFLRLSSKVLQNNRRFLSSLCLFPTIVQEAQWSLAMIPMFLPSRLEVILWTSSTRFDARRIIKAHLFEDAHPARLVKLDVGNAFLSPINSVSFLKGKFAHTFLPALHPVASSTGCTLC